MNYEFLPICILFRRFRSDSLSSRRTENFSGRNGRRRHRHAMMEDKCDFLKTLGIKFYNKIT